MTTQVLVKREIILDGLNCAHCAEVINEKVNNLEEVDSANLNFINKILTLNKSIERLSYNSIRQKISNYILDEYKKQNSHLININMTINLYKN